MVMIIKIANTLLILFSVFMGFKQGWGMITARPDMLEMFTTFNMSKAAMMAVGIITILSAALILLPQTFFYGNFITAAVILFMAARHLHHKDLKDAAIELPFFLLSLLIIYLRHPLER